MISRRAVFEGEKIAVIAQAFFELISRSIFPLGAASLLRAFLEGDYFLKWCRCGTQEGIW